MRSTALTIIFFSVVALFNCNKNEIIVDPETYDTITLLRLEIRLNGDPYKDYLISNQDILEENIFTQESRIKKINYSWDKSRMVQIKTYYDSDDVNFITDSIFYDLTMRIK